MASCAMIYLLWPTEVMLGNNGEISSYTKAIARQWPQQIRNTARTRSVRLIRDATIEQLLGEVFSLFCEEVLYAGHLEFSEL
jgi:hypothetical protein